MGLHQSNMVLRLEDHTRQEFLKLAGAHTFEPMPGRPMREYVVVPPTLITDSKKLTPWVSKALEYGTTLKPKEKGAKAKSAAKAKSQATKKKKK